GMAVGGLPYNPADSAFGGKYTLTTREGLVMTIDGLSGRLETVSDRNGSLLTYRDDGIFSSAGVAVTFQRDALGRISGVTDPQGARIRYGYDANGDLVSVTDREDNVTQYQYSSVIPHYMEGIIDPLGRVGARMEYDDQGRLSGGTDVRGNATALTYDIDSDS